MAWSKVTFQGKIVLIINILIIVFYKKIRKFLDPEDKYKNKYSFKDLILILPVLTLFAQEFLSDIFGLNVGFQIKELLDSKILEWVLTTLGCYGIVIAAAGDLGIDPGNKQNKIIQNLLVKFFIMFGTAYDFTGKKNKALYATFLFYILKYAVSDNTE